MSHHEGDLLGSMSDIRRPTPCRTRLWALGMVKDVPWIARVYGHRTSLGLGVTHGVDYYHSLGIFISSMNDCEIRDMLRFIPVYSLTASQGIPRKKNQAYLRLRARK